MSNSNPFSDPSSINIQFAHVAYQLESRFAARDTTYPFFQTWDKPTTADRIKEADVLVVSGYWEDSLLEQAEKLKFIQSIGAGYDQFPLEKLKERGIRLASASGVNKNAVSEQAMSMILALTRKLHTSRDNQHKRHWRGMISDLDHREDELGDKTILIIGLGTIGSRLAKLAKAFDMHILATKRDTAITNPDVDELHPSSSVAELLPRADFVVLTCPLTESTSDLINTNTLSQMKPGAYLINVARGGCVEESALLHALQTGSIAGAAIDHFKAEPLPEDSPFWELENLIITPHTGGETSKYEDNLIDILLENLGRLARGESQLLNQIV